jgi:pimeloyl-ACP methyl ester carboxylesterase
MRTLMSGILFITLMLPMVASAKPAEFINEPYGSHERQVFDLWMPKGAWFKKAPLVIFIHGGGWSVGSKDEFGKNQGIIRKFNRTGFAVAAINYRFLKHANLQTIMKEDIGGFVQFIRYHSDHYRIDKKRIMAYGYSAGASASLWLATHPDLADPESPNPIKRESSRIMAAGHANGQVSYDYQVWFDHFGKENTLHFMKDQVWSRYGLKSLDDLYTAEGIRIRNELNMFGHLSSDDAPLFIYNDLADDETRDGNHFIHSPRHARILAHQARSLGLTVETHIRADGGITLSAHQVAHDFFEDQLNRIKERKKNRKKAEVTLYRRMLPGYSSPFRVNSPFFYMQMATGPTIKGHNNPHHRSSHQQHSHARTHAGKTKQPLRHHHPRGRQLLASNGN